VPRRDDDLDDEKIPSGTRPHNGDARCSECGAGTLEYSIALNKGLVDGLVKLYKVGGPVNLRDADLDHVQRCTIQELRYWSFIEPVLENNQRRAGVWTITPIGRLFVEGTITAPKIAWHYRRKLVGFEGERVSIAQVTGTYADDPFQARLHVA